MLLLCHAPFGCGQFPCQGTRIVPATAFRQTGCSPPGTGKSPLRRSELHLLDITQVILHIPADCINFAFAQLRYMILSSLCPPHDPIKLTGVRSVAPIKGEKHPRKKGTAPVEIVCFPTIFARLLVFWEIAFPTMP
jgi:hypothetical protein